MDLIKNIVDYLRIYLRIFAYNVSINKQQKKSNYFILKKNIMQTNA